MKNQERDIPRKIILELLKKGHVHYAGIEKKAVATCLRFATSNTVRKQFYHYLLANGYVERVSRGRVQNHRKRRKTLRNPDLAPLIILRPYGENKKCTVTYN